MAPSYLSPLLLDNIMPTDMDMVAARDTSQESQAQI